MSAVCLRGRLFFRRDPPDERPRFDGTFAAFLARLLAEAALRTLKFVRISSLRELGM
jgi:hypothetical protein